MALSEGDIERAQSLYEEAVELFERENVPVRQAVVLANLAAIATMRGDLETATVYAARAAGLQRELRDTDGLAVTLHNFSRILMAQGLTESRQGSRANLLERLSSLVADQLLLRQ